MTTIKTYFSLRECFSQLRNDKNHHLGMGDIRLTIDQQDQISDIFDKYTGAINRSKFWEESARLIDEYRKEGKEDRAQAIIDCRILFNRLFS